MFTRFLSIATAVTFATSISAAAAATLSVDAGTLGGSRDLGRAPSSVRVRISVVLKYQHEVELERLVEAQADPASRLYHHFLTSSEFSAHFAPATAEYGRIVASLQRGGFTITQTFPNRTVVDAWAPAPVAARYFGTDIDRVLSAVGSLTYVNTRAAVVPSDIAGATLGVFGLDGTVRLHAPPMFSQRNIPRTPAVSARRNGYPLFGPYGGYGPQIFAGAYDLLSASGYTGAGRATGVEMDGDFLETDLAAYLSYFGVARTGPPTTRIPVDGGAPAFPGGDAPETTEDVQAIVSLAPGTGLYVYEIPSLSDVAVLDGYNRVVSDNLVDTLNSSLVVCEDFPKQWPRAVDAVETQGAAEGITFHSATGDNGVYGFNCKKTSINAPADTPHNVAVGGTRLIVDPTTGKETSEVGWNDVGIYATGGGVSAVFKAPPYQKSVPNLIARGRNIPDVAFDASPLSGAELYFNGSFCQCIAAGTSLSSPIFGAALTEINQLQNSRSGYFNVTLYDTWLANGYKSGTVEYFRDISQGSIPPYYAQLGYDQMSGIGAMQAANFASLLH